MKINGTKYATMTAAMRAVVETAGGAARVREHFAASGLTTLRMLWDVWNGADRNLRYDDSHPAFASGQWTRAYPQDAGFNLYADPSVNDTHIETALKKIGRELGLVQ